MYYTNAGLHVLILMMYSIIYAGSLKVSFQLLLSIMVPIIIILLILSLALIVIAVIIRKSWKNRAKVKALQAQVMEPELSTIYEEVDSKPEHIMEENMAYNTVQEFNQETVKSEDIPV